MRTWLHPVQLGWMRSASAGAKEAWVETDPYKVRRDMPQLQCCTRRLWAGCFSVAARGNLSQHLSRTALRPASLGCQQVTCSRNAALSCAGWARQARRGMHSTQRARCTTRTTLPLSVLLRLSQHPRDFRSNDSKRALPGTQFLLHRVLASRGWSLCSFGEKFREELREEEVCHPGQRSPNPANPVQSIPCRPPCVCAIFTRFGQVGSHSLPPSEECCRDSPVECRKTSILGVEWIRKRKVKRDFWERCLLPKTLVNDTEVVALDGFSHLVLWVV